MANTNIATVQTTDKNINQLQANIQAAVNPLLANPVNSGVILKSVSLSIGQNTISHGLGKTLQGWGTIRVRAKCSLYDQQDQNPTPQTTLVLVSDQAAVVDLYVF